VRDLLNAVDSADLRRGGREGGREGGRVSKNFTSCHRGAVVRNLLDAVYSADLRREGGSDEMREGAHVRKGGREGGKEEAHT